MGDINDYVDQSDFEDQEDEFEDAEEGQQEPVKRGRGPDKEWFEEGVFDNKASFAESEFKKNLDKEITKKCGYDTVQARLEFYCCKHSKRKAYKPCPVFKKVAYLQESFKIAVFHNDEEHIHEINPNYDTPTNFHFTPEQENIIEEGIDSHSTNFFILKKLKMRNAHTNGVFPSLLEAWCAGWTYTPVLGSMPVLSFFHIQQ